METFRSNVAILQADGVVTKEQLERVKEKSKIDNQRMDVLSSKVDEYIKKDEKEKQGLKIKMEEMEKKLSETEEKDKEEIKRAVEEKLDKDEES